MRTPSSTWWRAASTTNGEPCAYPRAMPRLLTAPVSLHRTQARPHDPRDQGATVCSGAYRTLSMVVISCSMMTSRAYAPGSEHRPTHRGRSGIQATRAQPGDHLRVAVVEEELRAASGVAMAPLWASVSSESRASMSSGAQRDPPVGRRRSTTSCTKTLTGHTGEVHSVAVSPDGTRLATSNMDR